MTPAQHGGSTQVHRLGADRVPAVTAVPCDAFNDYPVMRYVLGPATGEYDIRLPTLVRLFVMARVLCGEPVPGIADGPVLTAAALVSVPELET